MKTPADYHWEMMGPDGGLRPDRPLYDLVKQRRLPDDACFLSIRFPNESRLAAPAGLLDNIRSKPTPPEHFHLTLLVAEQCSDDQLALFLANLSPIMPFSLEVAGLKLIAGMDAPVLVWSVDPGPALGRLQAELYNAVVNTSMVISPYSEPSEWIPHITLAYDLDSALNSEDLPLIPPFRLMVNSFTIGRSYEDYFEVSLPRGVGDDMFVQRHGKHIGQEGTPEGGSRPGFTHVGGAEEEQVSERMPISERLSNLRSELRATGIKGFRVKKVGGVLGLYALVTPGDPDAGFTSEQADRINEVVPEGVGIPSRRIEEGDTSYQINLIDLEKVFTSGNRPVERNRHGQETNVSLNDLSKLIYGKQIVKGALRRMVGIEDGPFVVERDSDMYLPTPSFGGAGEGTRGTGGSKQDGARVGMKKQETGFSADGKKMKWGLPHHRPVELFLPSDKDIQELSDVLEEWEGGGRAIVHELLPGDEDELEPVEKLVLAQIIEWFDDPDNPDIPLHPDQMFGMTDGEIQILLEKEAGALIEDRPEPEAEAEEGGPKLTKKDPVGREHVYTFARDGEEIVAAMVTTAIEENDYRVGQLADGAQTVAWREDYDYLPATFRPEHYVDESFETPYLFVDWLAVKHEGHGFGRQMLGEIFRQAAETDSGVYLEATNSAKAFYEKFEVNTTDDDTLFWTAEEVKEWAETVEQETEAYTSKSLVEREDIDEVLFGADQQTELKPVNVDDDLEPLDGGYTIGNMLWPEKPRPWKRQFRDQIEEVEFMSDEDAAVLDAALPPDQRFPDERETMLQGVQRAFETWARGLLALTQRHGKHEGQEARPGKIGGSQPGFTHGDEGDRDLPMAGDTVDGRMVKDHVPNTDSISASLIEWEELPGIREIKLSDFETGLEKPSFATAGQREAAETLAEEIRENDWIEPLIVVYDAESVGSGPYILEGSTRFDALRILGASALPALVIIDRDPETGIVKRHGKHIGQEGEEGRRGGSAEGFEHEEGSVGGEEELEGGEVESEEAFHGTGAEAARNIMEEGLQISYSDDDNWVSDVIYAAADRRDALAFATRSSEENYAVITIDSSLVGSDPIEPDEASVGLMFSQDIPSEAIVKIDIYQRGFQRKDDQLIETIERSEEESSPQLFIAAEITESGSYSFLGPRQEFESDLFQQNAGVERAVESDDKVKAVSEEDTSQDGDTSQNREDSDSDEDISTNVETGSESEIDEIDSEEDEGKLVERHLKGHVGQEGLPGGGSQPGYTHAGVATAEGDGEGHSVGEVYSVDANYFGTEEDVLVELLKWDPDIEAWTIEIISGELRENIEESSVGSYDLVEPDEDDLITWTETGGQALEDRAVSTFGLTDDFREAGFILTAGEMLDFSGKREGGLGGTRAMDHREVGRAMIDADYEKLPEERSASDGLIYFMNETGAVRVGYHGDSVAVDLATNPTRSQREIIETFGFLGGGIELDISSETGGILWSGRIDDPEDVSNEINRLAFEYLRNRAFITMVFRHGESQKRVVVGPLRRVVIERHGKHIDQQDEEEEDGDNVAA